jgi:uncharacterized membrane protein
VVGVDAARGLALLGMVAVHIVPPVTADGDVAWPFTISAGRSSALFAVLAGVGLALLTRWTPSTTAWQRRRDRVAIAVRAMVLVLIGLALGEPESGVAVILVYYGVLFCLALPFLGLSARALAAWSASVLLLVPALSHLVRPGLAPPSYAVPTIEFADQGWSGVASELLLTGYYPALPWMAYLLAGLAVGRLDLRSTTVATRLLAGGVLLAVGAAALSRLLLTSAGARDVLVAQTPTLFGRPFDQALDIGLYGTAPTGSWWWLAVDAPHTATPLDLAGTIGTSLAVLGLCLLLVKRPRAWSIPLIALGGMSLTVYSLHIVLLDGVLPRTMDDAVLWHVIVLSSGAVLWRWLVGQGPLEWVSQKVSRSVARIVVPGQRANHRPQSPASLR